MRLIAVISLLLCPLSAASSKEFFVLQGVDKTHSDQLVSQPGLSGFTIRVSWRKLHEEGFGWLDEQIRRGDELDVDLQLRVMAGVSAPANLPGVSYFEYLSTDFDGASEIRRVPVPWDAAMHQHWQALAANLANRYGSNPRVKVVHVPSFANSSELHMPVEVTELAGYSSRALSEAWAALAAPLAAAFPQAIVSLNYATPTQARIAGDDAAWLVDEMAALAGSRAGYQANDLAAHVSLERNKYQTLIAQEQLGRHVGFQMVSSSNAARFGGQFLEAVQIAAVVGAQWLEIYAADIGRIPPAGDYNLNGAVDAADYVAWRKLLGQTGNGLAGDGNGDNQIDRRDYDVWLAHFGLGVSSEPAVGPATNSAVPESATFVLLLTGILALMVAHGRPRRRVAALV